MVELAVKFKINVAFSVINRIFISIASKSRTRTECGIHVPVHVPFIYFCNIWVLKVSDFTYFLFHTLSMCKRLKPPNWWNWKQDQMTLIWTISSREGILCFSLFGRSWQRVYTAKFPKLWNLVRFISYESFGYIWRVRKNMEHWSFFASAIYFVIYLTFCFKTGFPRRNMRQWK